MSEFKELKTGTKQKVYFLNQSERLKVAVAEKKERYGVIAVIISSVAKRNC